MKLKTQTLLPALFLPFLALPSLAQTTGVAHPDQSTEIAAQGDHYVKPSAAAAHAPAYQDSFPATAADPQPQDQPGVQAQTPPALINRSAAQPLPATCVQSAVAVPAPAPINLSRNEETGNDDGIVLAVPTRPHQLNQGTLLHARLREALSTQTATVGQTFTAELLEDVGHNGEVMLPAGSLIRGHISSVHGGARISGGASLRLQPETISLPDGTLYSIQAQITDLEGTQDLRVNDEGTVTLRTHPKAEAAVLGGVTATAAVTGAAVGGGIGAAVGAVAGAGVATAVWLKRDIQEKLPVGSTLIFALNEPLTVTPR